MLVLGWFVSDTEPGIPLPGKAEGRGALTPSTSSQGEAERPGSEARGSRKKCVCLCVCGRVHGKCARVCVCVCMHVGVCVCPGAQASSCICL